MQLRNYISLTSSELMDKVKNSDENAFQTLFDKLWERMYTLAFSMLQDKDIAKDIVQEVWINIWERRDAIENDNIEAYLLKATRFKVYKTLRDSKLKKVQVESLEFVETHNSYNILEKLYYEDTNSKVEKTVSKLPSKCQQVFTLSRSEGLKNSEISEKLGISPRTVETHISNAIKRIKCDVVISTMILLSFLF